MGTLFIQQQMRTTPADWHTNAHHGETQPKTYSRPAISLRRMAMASRGTGVPDQGQYENEPGGDD
eukprot:scaffold7569_cov27-Tisochrysis_lutea.AAC.1